MTNRELLKAIKRLNDLTISDLASITDTSERLIESWLYESNRQPSNFALYLLWQYIPIANGIMPRELNRFALRYYNKIRREAAKRRRAEKMEVVGEIVQEKRTNLKFNYRGKYRSITEIAALSGRSYNAVYQHIRYKKIESGSDITLSLDSNQSQRRDQNGKG